MAMILVLLNLAGLPADIVDSGTRGSGEGPVLTTPQTQMRVLARQVVEIMAGQVADGNILQRGSDPQVNVPSRAPF